MIVTEYAEAIFEDGFLRPLKPLSLQDGQHVLLTITDALTPGANSGRMPEQEWLRAHGQEYKGQVDRAKWRKPRQPWSRRSQGAR